MTTAPEALRAPEPGAVTAYHRPNHQKEERMNDGISATASGPTDSDPDPDEALRRVRQGR